MGKRAKRRSEKKPASTLRVDPTRHYKIAMVATSLVAGVLSMVNLDRTLHQPLPQDRGYLASDHGWPLVFLHRNFEEDIPNHLREMRSNDWPYPFVEGEVRDWNGRNLAVDVVVALVILVIVYWFTRAAIWRLDHRKQTDAN